MNAFMAWSQEERRRLVAEGSGNNCGVFALGERWKQLDDKEKMFWKRTAEKHKKEQNQVDSKEKLHKTFKMCSFAELQIQDKKENCQL